jgi:hypothetical protein
MHWLAYWNDSASVKYLLEDIVEENVSKEILEELMHISFNGMTPIDMAGKNNSLQAANEILNFFTARYKFCEYMFDLPVKDSELH